MEGCYVHSQPARIPSQLMLLCCLWGSWVKVSVFVLQLVVFNIPNICCGYSHMLWIFTAGVPVVMLSAL